MLFQWESEGKSFSAQNFSVQLNENGGAETACIKVGMQCFYAVKVG